MAPQQFDPPPPPPPPPPYWDGDRPPKSMRRMRPEDSQSLTSMSSTSDSMATTTYQGISWSDEPSAAAISTKSWRPQYSGYPRPPPPPHGSRISAAVWGAAGAVATLAIMCLIGGCCLFFCRRARKRRNAAREMPPQQMIKTNGRSMAVADTRAYAPSLTVLPPSTLTSPSTVSAPSTQNEEAPILLSTNIDRSYYTGIDTSDVISIVDHQRPPSNDIGYAASITEPPPPYRPTSIPSFSRESSCRTSGAPPSYRPRLSIISPTNAVRSPFDDPEGESPVSELGTSAERESPIIRDMEEMSDVSELSYQQEPTQVRSSL